MVNEVIDKRGVQPLQSSNKTLAMNFHEES